MKLSIAVRSGGVNSSQATRRSLPGSIAWHDRRGQALTQVFQSLRDGPKSNKSTGTNSSNMEKTSQCSNLKQEIFKKGEKILKKQDSTCRPARSHIFGHWKVQSWVKVEKGIIRWHLLISGKVVWKPGYLLLLINSGNLWQLMLVMVSLGNPSTLERNLSPGESDLFPLFQTEGRITPPGVEGGLVSDC